MTGSGALKSQLGSLAATSLNAEQREALYRDAWQSHGILVLTRADTAGEFEWLLLETIGKRRYGIRDSGMSDE